MDHTPHCCVWTSVHCVLCFCYFQSEDIGTPWSPTTPTPANPDVQYPPDTYQRPQYPTVAYTPPNVQHAYAHMPQHSPARMQHPANVQTLPGNMQQHPGTTTPAGYPGPGYDTVNTGYTPNPVYSTRTHYRAQTYPTFSSPHSQTGENLYNISTTRTCHYESGDELEKPDPEGTVYESDLWDQPPPSAMPNPTSHQHHYGNSPQHGANQNQNHGSLDSSYRHRHYSNDNELRRHASLEHNLAESHEELTPSRFGSKRESAVNYNNYPATDSNTNNSYPGSQRHPGGPGYTQGAGSPGVHPGVTPTHPGAMQTPGNYGYDRQAYPANYANNYQQQQPPRTPQFEAPPVSFTHQEYLPLTMNATNNPSMTVTTRQNHVEMSKPFEMSDFYKYSEKFRKQKTAQGVQRLEAVLSGSQPPPSPMSPQPMSPHTPTNQIGGHTDAHSHGQWSPSPPQQPVLSNMTPACQHSASITHYGPYTPHTPTHPPTGAHPHTPTHQPTRGVLHYGDQQSPTIKSYQPPQPQQCEAVNVDRLVQNDRKS